MSLEADSVGGAAFTYRQRAVKVLHSLRGLICGITADQRIKPQECDYLSGWLDRHAAYGVREPFGELFTYVHETISEGFLKESLREEILDGVDHLAGGYYFPSITTRLNELHAMLGGIAADRLITIDELRVMRSWMDQHCELRRHWPFDEIDSLITGTMKDGVISPDEHARLVSVFSEFLHDSPNLTRMPLDAETGEVLVSCDPEFQFDGRIYCVTGISSKATRGQVEECIRLAGGIVHSRVVGDLNFLIYCEQANPAWAYSCYGRKVESVLHARKNGATTVLAREVDLWDALLDKGISVARRTSLRSGQPSGIRIESQAEEHVP